MSYSADRGEWCFDVEHFSRYGLVDSDSESEDYAAAKGRDTGGPQPDEGSEDMQEGVGKSAALYTCCLKSAA